MHAMQLSAMEIMSAAPLKGLAVPHASTVSESFGRTWQREIEAVKTTAPEQSRAASDAAPCSVVHEKSVQEDSDSAQKVGIEAGKKRDQEAESKAEGPVESNEGDGKHEAHDLPKVALTGEPRLGVIAGAVTKITTDGRTPLPREKRTGEAAKFAGAAESGRPKVGEIASGVAGAVMIGEAKSAAAVVKRSAVWVKLPEELQTRPAKGSQPRKIAALPADRLVTVEAIARDAPPETARVANESVQSSVAAKMPEQLQNQTAKGSEPKRVAAAARADRPATAAKVPNSVAQKTAHTTDETTVSRPAKARTKSASVESGAQHKTPTSAIHIGVPTSENYVGNSLGGRKVPLSAAAVVPAPTSGHPVAGPVRAETRLDGTRLVAGSGAAAPQMLSSGPTRLDVGVFDGTHGWLRIRAELGVGGAVNASLTAGGAMHESLRAALPEMANYLQSEAVSVSRIALHRAAPGANSMTATEGQQNGSAQRHGAAGEQAQTGDGSLKRNLRVTEQREAGSVSEASQSATQALNGGVARTMQAAGLGFGYSGGWLNVCA
jgi:hypothetical protein